MSVTNTKKLLSSLACLISLLITSSCWAQDDEPITYQIELVVFERLEQATGQDNEVWPKNINMFYPDNWKKLIDPEEQALEKAKLEQLQQLENRWELSQEFLDSIASEPNVAEPPSVNTSETATDVAAQVETTDGAVDEEQIQEVPTPIFYQYLPKDQHQLTQTVRAINRAGELRVLYHNSWHQQLFDKNEAPALVLRGGNHFGEHRELEGSIKLYVSRYIHIQSDLWLTQFVPNHGQQSDHWPSLPSQPNKVEDLYNRLTQNIDLSGLAQQIALAPPSASNLPPANSDASTLENSNDLSNPYLTAIADSPDTTLLAGGGLGIKELDIDRVIGETSAPYLINQIITLRQSRRMRSKELHYIDHPRIGLLVLVTPLETPEQTAL